MGFLNRVKKIASDLQESAAHATDPEYDQRVAACTAALYEELNRRQGQVDLEAIRAKIGARSYQLEESARHCYVRFLNTAWEDGKISPTQRRQLGVVSIALGLKQKDKSRCELEYAAPIFIKLVHEAMADGVLTSEELTKLDLVAEGLGRSRGALIRELMQKDAAGLIRKAFSPDFGVPIQEQIAALKRIQGIATALGFTDKEIQRILKVEALQIAEFALAGASCDGPCSDFNAELLIDLLREAPLDGATYLQFEKRIEETVYRRQLESGTKRLPSVQCEFVDGKPGEIWHWCGQVLFSKQRITRGEKYWEEQEGQIAISDVRYVFQSFVQSSVIVRNLRTVLKSDIDKTSVLLTTRRGKRAFTFERQIPAVIFSIALQRANRKGGQSVDDRRRISRDVRQRVFTRDNGACVSCGATEYIEYDHIIPVSKGGSNSEQNIQVLCRGCNSAKSDSI